MIKGSQTKLTACSAVDASNALQQPLDFSFTHLGNFNDAVSMNPRDCKLKKCADTNKYNTKFIKFSNNALTNFDNFDTTLQQLITDPESLEILDLSYNSLSTIDEVLQHYSKVKFLNLRGNRIENLKEIDTLAGLPNLQYLTINGNPIDTCEQCKNYILSVIPHLKKLNDAVITKQDRMTAMYSSPGGSKRKGRMVKGKKCS